MMSAPKSSVDYLVIGHVSTDIAPQGDMLGGTATYAAIAASTLGLRTGVVTRAAGKYDWPKALPDVQVHQIPSTSTTTYQNTYTPSGRQQKIHCISEALGEQDVPAIWRNTPLVHLGPIANEIDPDLIHLFPQSTIGLTPQGWLRAWDAGGHVYATKNADASRIFSNVAAVILSEEDLVDGVQLDGYRKCAKVLVLTQGSSGCTVTFGGETRHIPVNPVPDVVPTGAGDIFAAAFLIRYRQTGGNPWAAARFANCIAAATVSEPELAAKADRIREIHATMAYSGNA